MWQIFIQSQVLNVDDDVFNENNFIMSILGRVDEKSFNYYIIDHNGGEFLRENKFHYIIGTSGTNSNVRTTKFNPWRELIYINNSNITSPMEIFGVKNVVHGRYGSIPEVHRSPPTEERCPKVLQRLQYYRQVSCFNSEGSQTKQSPS